MRKAVAPVRGASVLTRTTLDGTRNKNAKMITSSSLSEI